MLLKLNFYQISFKYRAKNVFLESEGESSYYTTILDSLVEFRLAGL